MIPKIVLCISYINILRDMLASHICITWDELKRQ